MSCASEYRRYCFVLAQSSSMYANFRGIVASSPLSCIATNLNNWSRYSCPMYFRRNEISVFIRLSSIVIEYRLLPPLSLNEIDIGTVNKCCSTDLYSPSSSSSLKLSGAGFPRKLMRPNFRLICLV